MPNQDSGAAKIIEPLAKFQSKLRPQGKVMIPIYIREYYGIQDGDFVVVIIRVPDESKRVRGRIFAVAKVYDRGVFTIPKKVRDKYGLKVGDFVEILLIDYILVRSQLESKVGPILTPKVQFNEIDESSELQILKKTLN
uniref:T26-20p n=1 Tax=Thermococcus sp. 26/2 TaxID=758583 RepID=D6MY43_9EURY|nr:t26-20p [Thermococcus sp. 26/2]